MRKTLSSGVLGVLIGAAIFYLAAAYVGRQPNSWPAKIWQMAQPGAGERNPVYGLSQRASLAEEEQEAAHPAEARQFVEALLPDPAKLTGGWQPFETIDLLKPPEPSIPAQPENPASEDILPAADFHTMEELESLQLLPYAEAIELLTVMPSTDEAELDLNQDNKTADLEPMVDPKVIQERLDRILESHLKNGLWPQQAGVDTLEFRPSDAKKGEFGPIPF